MNSINETVKKYLPAMPNTVLSEMMEEVAAVNKKRAFDQIQCDEHNATLQEIVERKTGTIGLVGDVKKEIILSTLLPILKQMPLKV